jgi:hypothetical protein
MTLTDYIKSIGDEAFARRHSVSIRCARSWRLGQRAPRPQKALRIVQDTDGLVSLSEVYAVPATRDEAA